MISTPKPVRKVPSSRSTQVSEKKTRINQGIFAQKVRLVGVNREQLGIVTLTDALQAAKEAHLDLVEIAPTAQPPVCRIMNHGKYLFELSKQKALQKKKQKRIEVKEIKFRPVTEDADYQVKLRKVITFLQEGDKVKITLKFRGREITHMELGTRILLRLQNDLADYGVVEMAPKVEGRQMVLVLGPKKAK